MPENEKKKIKVLTISDHPLYPSGVGTQTRYIIEGMLDTGRFQFITLGGALQHMDPRASMTEKYGEDWLLFPVNGYGDPDTLRSVIRQYRPDMLWFMTDPRFYGWLWEMENEIRPIMPMVYYHVWDNYPYPKYNRAIYESTDTIATISKVTSDIVRTVSPLTNEIYLPHAVDSEIFKKLPEDEIRRWKKEAMPWAEDRFIFFWNNRNARRKQSGTIIHWFKNFLDKVGHDKATLLMHTDPKDIHGQDLTVLIADWGLYENNQVMLSTDKVPANGLAIMYNACDCTINASDAEGFGLCNYAKSLVILETGAKKIEDIVEGDKVLTKEGTFEKVLNTSSRIEERPLLEIKSVGNPPLRVTEEHPIWAAKLNNIQSQHSKMNLLESVHEKDIELKWFKAKDLSPGDFVVFPKIKPFKNNVNEIDLLEFIQEKPRYLKYDDEFVWIQEHKKTKRFIKIDDKFKYLVGWFLAEGNVDNGRAFILDFNSNEFSKAKHIAKIYEKIFGKLPKVYKHPELGLGSNRCRLRDSNSIVGKFFKQLCGSGSRNKFIHKILLNNITDSNFLVKGLFEGDGNINKHFSTWRLTNTSSHLMWQIKSILATNGIYSSITKESNAAGFGNRSIYKLNIGVANIKRFSSWTNLDHPEDKLVRKKAKERRWIEKENYFLVPIRKINIWKENQKVCDIQVENNKNFVSNGVVVHNSTLESLACETPIIVNMTGGLQEQVTPIKEVTEEIILKRTDEKPGVTVYEHGIGIEPASRTTIGSQETPYIYEDRVKEADFQQALMNMFKSSKKQRKAWGKAGAEYVKKNYNFENFIKQWDEVLTDTYKKHGSWDTRTPQHNIWELKEL